MTTQSKIKALNAILWFEIIASIACIVLAILFKPARIPAIAFIQQAPLIAYICMNGVEKLERSIHVP